MKTIDEVLATVSIDENQDASQYLILQLMKLRNSKGITQNQLAQQIDVSHTTIARIENFSMQPTLKMLTRILDVYGMTLDIVPKKEQQNLSSERYNSLSVSDEISVTDSKTIASVLSDFNDNISLSIDYKPDFLHYISDVFLVYTNSLKKHKINSYVINQVNRFSKYINIITDEYCCGHHNLAYDLFKDALSACIDTTVFIRDMSNNKVLYRGRKKAKTSYTKQQMFHIPFENRHIVSTQRYSYPGLPCLYLGSSPEVCASELSKDISELVIARFTYHSKKADYKILDLTSILFDYFAGLYETCAQSFFINFSLILICSIHIKYAEESKVKFRKEYVFPQLLLEYIINESILKENKVIGIKYFSTTDNFIDDFLRGDFYSLQKKCNYVFPAEDAKKSNGYCTQLESMFEVAEIQGQD